MLVVTFYVDSGVCWDADIIGLFVIVAIRLLGDCPL